MKLYRYICNYVRLYLHYIYYYIKKALFYNVYKHLQRVLHFILHLSYILFYVRHIDILFQCSIVKLQTFTSSFHWLL